MGRFEAKHLKIREFNWGRIIFNDKFHLTVQTPRYHIIFHRYGAPHGDYTKSWRLFRQQLLRRKLPNFYDVYKYANHYDIASFVQGVASGNDSRLQS